MGINDDETLFLTQEEQYLFQLSQNDLDYEESYDYNKGFENDIKELHRQYNLRSTKN